MTGYLLRRLVLVIPTLFGIIAINFAVVQMAPGGPVEQMSAELKGQGSVVTREVMEQRLYSFEAQLGSNALEVLIHRLRRRLQEVGAAVVIHTVRGVGYLMAEAR